VPFESAERDCQSRGGHLAGASSKAENDLIKTLIGKVDSWIGLVVPQGGAQLTWLNGETSAFAEYAPAQPDASGSCVLSSQASGGWDDRACGWPSAGKLPPSPAGSSGYVCEQSCGNGVLEAGEECDPPGPSCTTTCRNKRPCTEAGGLVSPVTGRCYFVTAASVNYTNALNACPTGTHLATPNQPSETEIALKVVTADSWIALRAPAGLSSFAWDVVGVKFDAQRYHGFASPDPDQPTSPSCTVVSKGDARGDAWRDRACTDQHPALCERD
jgi:hypothetical protein